MTKNGVLGESVEVTGNTVPKGQGGLPRATSRLVVSLVIKNNTCCGGGVAQW